MCACVLTVAPGSFRMVCGGRPTRCSPGGGACPPEPCSGFCEVPGCPTPTYRGKEGLTSCSLSLAHLEVHIRSGSPGQWPRSAGGLSCPSLGHTPRSRAAVGPSRPPCGARSLWSGDPSPSPGVQRGVREAGPWQPGPPLLQKGPVWLHKARPACRAP